ncbi:DUF6083 domain-containing protein [Streptomyces sp. NPDC059340]|uniref:DUF6083 domain-containing protein n=1 Tax=Streptomyces sp. NPDC059340 TaxID=3346806 RepID=UPI0036BD845F
MTARHRQKPPYRQSRQDRVQAREEGATALAPPEAPVCPECGLEADRFPTLSQAWVLLEPLEPEHVVAAHLVPPRLTPVARSTRSGMRSPASASRSGVYKRCARRSFSPRITGSPMMYRTARRFSEPDGIR